MVVEARGRETEGAQVEVREGETDTGIKLEG